MDAPKSILKLLHKGDEDQRRHRIIDAGRSRDVRYVPQLIARLESDESYDNKRHIVRALGHLGGELAKARLLILLECANDEMLGDVVHSLGELKVREAIARIKSLVSHDVAWVSQNASWALHQFSNTKE